MSKTSCEVYILYQTWLVGGPTVHTSRCKLANIDKTKCGTHDCLRTDLVFLPSLSFRRIRLLCSIGTPYGPAVPQTKNRISGYTISKYDTQSRWPSQGHIYSIVKCDSKKCVVMKVLGESSCVTLLVISPVRFFSSSSLLWIHDYSAQSDLSLVGYSICLLH